MEFAKMIGVTKGRVTQLCGAGLPQTADGRIIPRDGLAWVEANLDPSRRKPVGQVREEGADRSGRADIEREKAAEQLRKLRLENARLERALVDRSMAERFILSCARSERDALIGWCMRMAPVLAAELGADQQRTFAILDREMRRHLEARARQPLEIPDDDDSSDGRA